MTALDRFSENPLPLFEGQELLITGPKGADPAYIKDHRRRLRDRFCGGGAASLPDYELLELILFRSLPKCDVSPVARRLIDTFGDLNAVLSASKERLIEVRGVGDVVATDLKIIEAATHRMARAKVMDRPVLSSWQSLIDYCHTAMSHQQTEVFRVLYLNRKNVLIADEEQARGTVDHVPVYPREIMRRCLELNASALILVHNHPSGDPTPSQSDIEMTLNIETAAQALGLVLHDHLVIGKSREISMRSDGYL
ncbi:DNA repair protein RadC [Nereida sp. MMG025]|uniref:RadC family protein n=1 Tax=Nereida sp. MMG025 TaxID=2909981 RepID=UPI001EFFDEEB|nr:DNA repair protein RadC [Nereida sp. MMG025]MCF6444565.1 DNA repair protein RadC [Nereida sp. MMG025]